MADVRWVAGSFMAPGRANEAACPVSPHRTSERVSQDPANPNRVQAIGRGVAMGLAYGNCRVPDPRTGEEMQRRAALVVNLTFLRAGGMRSSRMQFPTLTRVSRNGGITRVDALALMAGILILGGSAGSWASIRFGGEESRRIRCMDNVRRLALASVMYAGDNRDHMPHSSWGSLGLGGGYDSWAYAVWVNGVPIPTARGETNGDRQKPFAEAGQLRPWVGSSEAFFCPSDVHWSSGDGASLWRMRDNKTSSFAMNAAAIGFGRLPFGRTYPMSRFRPDAFIFLEPNELDPFFFDDAALRPSEGISGRHRQSLHSSLDPGLGASHVGLADGSVQWISVAAFEDEAGRSTFQAPRVALPNRAWCEPGSATGGR